MKAIIKRFKSKTVILSAITGLMGVMVQYSPQFKAVLDDNYSTVLVVLAILGWIIREFTSKPLSEK